LDWRIPEKRLWQAIRRKQLGVEFHRQVPIDQFIVDFYCHELLLAIEVDGSSHDSPDAAARDAERQQRLEGLGVSVLRFRDAEVIGQGDAVARAIKKWMEERTCHPR